MPGKPIKSYWSGGNLYFDESVAASGANIVFNCELLFDDTSVTNIFNFSAAATTLMTADASGDGGITVSADAMSQDPETASEDGFIAIDVAGTTYEIPFYEQT
jgi:hypothetical protein